MRRPQVVFLGTHGQYNVGDELLLETFLKRLGATPRYSINSYDPASTTAWLGERFDIDAFATNGPKAAFAGRLRRCDMVVFGGGSIIKELYASVGRNRYATLAMVAATVAFAKWVARVPVVMSNVGVGPLPTRAGQQIAKAILANVDDLTVRDQGSYDLCRSIGLGRSQVRLVADAALSNTAAELLAEHGAPQSPQPQSPVSQSPESRSEPQSPVTVALNLNYDIANGENWGYFLDRLAEALSALNRDQQIRIVGLSMQSAFKENHDAAVLEAFAKRVPEIEFEQRRPETPAEAAQVIAEADLLCSERLHALVMAAILGVPGVALAYDVKVSELAAMLDMPSVDINTKFSSAVLHDHIAATIKDRAAIGAELAVAAETARVEVLGNFDRLTQKYPEVLDRGN